MKYVITTRSDGEPCVRLESDRVDLSFIDKDDPLLLFPIKAYQTITLNCLITLTTQVVKLML